MGKTAVCVALILANPCTDASTLAQMRKRKDVGRNAGR